MRFTRAGKIVLLSTAMALSMIVTRNPSTPVETIVVPVSDAATYWYTEEPAPAKAKAKVKKTLRDRARWTPRASRSHARSVIGARGWSHRQFVCLDSLWTHESNWRQAAKNHHPVYQNGRRLYAGGIPQILGLNPKTPVPAQVQAGFDYIEGRYGTPCEAWSFWKAHHWY